MMTYTQELIEMAERALLAGRSVIIHGRSTPAPVITPGIPAVVIDPGWVYTPGEEESDLEMARRLG